MQNRFRNSYTALQRSLISRLAEIEQSDADACANCGGEDCVCCEIYQDRKRWQEPEELFADDDWYGWYGCYGPNHDEEDDEEEIDE